MQYHSQYYLTGRLIAQIKFDNSTKTAHYIVGTFLVRSHIYINLNSLDFLFVIAKKKEYIEVSFSQSSE